MNIKTFIELEKQLLDRFEKDCKSLNNEDFSYNNWLEEFSWYCDEIKMETN